MTPLKTSLYKTARIREDAEEVPRGFGQGQFVAVEYLGIGDNDEPCYKIAANGQMALIEASQLERFCL